MNDKHPVIILKDVDFENLKSLVEYMYKGEANVAQHMLQSFIRLLVEIILLQNSIMVVLTID